MRWFAGAYSEGSLCVSEEEVWVQEHVIAQYRWGVTVVMATREKVEDSEEKEAWPTHLVLICFTYHVGSLVMVVSVLVSRPRAVAFWFGRVFNPEVDERPAAHEVLLDAAREAGHGRKRKLPSSATLEEDESTIYL